MLGFVKNLIPFQNLTLPMSLQADVIRINPNICLKFALNDPEMRIRCPNPFQVSGDQVPRQDGLWKDTCFELFLQPQNQSAYYEFNFSLLPAWNLYRFDRYREPQPPTPNEDFKLRMMKWDGKILTVDLFIQYPIMDLSAGITAVLKEKSGDQHYLALAHKGPKADFHLADSFVLKI